MGDLLCLKEQLARILGDISVIRSQMEGGRHPENSSMLKLQNKIQVMERIDYTEFINKMEILIDKRQSSSVG